MMWTGLLARSTATTMPREQDVRVSLGPSCTVALVMMPFGPTDRPSLGLSLLAQCLNDAGLSAKVLYPNLDFQQRIGEGLYLDMSSSPFNSTLAGEWLFSQV